MIIEFFARFFYLFLFSLTIFSCVSAQNDPSRYNSSQNYDSPRTYYPQTYAPYAAPRSRQYNNPYDIPPRGYSPYYDYDQYYVPPTGYSNGDQYNQSPKIPNSAANNKY